MTVLNTLLAARGTCTGARAGRFTTLAAIALAGTSAYAHAQTTPAASPNPPATDTASADAPTANAATTEVRA